MGNKGRMPLFLKKEGMGSILLTTASPLLEFQCLVPKKSLINILEKREEGGGGSQGKERIIIKQDSKGLA